MSATINPEKILKELGELWTETARPAESGGSGVLRACAMTMLVIADESEDTQGIGETLAQLMREHPSRAIVIRLKESSEPLLESRVFAQCWKPFGSRQHICCEQIEITSSDASLPDVPAVVLPLIVADLPVVLWCRSGRATELAGFREIVGLAQKVIFDSACFPDPTQALKRLRDASLAGTRVADLAWGRLTRSRELIAQALNSDDLIRKVEGVNEIRVRTRGPEPNVAARYFASWIASNLKSAVLKWEMEDWPEPLSLKGITLTSPDGFALSAQVKEMAGSAAVVDIEVEGRVNQVVLIRPSEYELLLEELSIPGRDAVYENVLLTAEKNIGPRTHTDTHE